MRLADARRPEQQERIAMLDPAAGGQVADLRLVDRGLGGDVEPVAIAHDREACEPDAHLGAPLVLAGDLALTEERQRLAQARLALGGLVQQRVERVADRS